MFKPTISGARAVTSRERKPQATATAAPALTAASKDVYGHCGRRCRIGHGCGLCHSKTFGVTD